MSDEHTLIDHSMMVLSRQRPVLAVGMQDEPVRCYRINKEWCKYIIGAISELINLQAWETAEDERHTGIQQLLMLLEGDVCVTCEEVEACLQISPIIININANITNIETDIVNIVNDVTNIEVNITEVTNIYPPPPPPEQGADLCSAAVYIATKLSDFWHQVVTDAQTITWDEFIENLIPGGGNDVGLLKLLWDFVVSNANPNLVTEGEAAFNEVVKILHCNQFDRDLVDLEIDASPSITSDAKGLWRGAWASFTDGKIAQWLYIGSLKGYTSESCICTEICGLNDFRENEYNWQQVPFSLAAYHWTDGIGYVGDPTNHVGQDWNAVHTRKLFTLQAVNTVTINFDLVEGIWDESLSTVQVQVITMLNGATIHSVSVHHGDQPDGNNQSVTLDNAGDTIDEIRVLVRAAIGASIISNPGSVTLKWVSVVCP